MTDPHAEDVPTTEEPFTVEPPSDIPPDVEFVFPASVTDAIDTDDELSREGESTSPAPLAALDLAPALRAIEGLERSLEAKLDGLATRFDREIRAEATREKVVDRLHAELQEYKQDLLLSVLRPIFVDLIQLHDDVGKMAATLSGDEAASPESARFRDHLAGVQQGIEDILYSQGVEPFSHESEGFDARRQRAVSTVPTEDAALARKVAERHRKGFASGDRVIRPEIVSVYVARTSPPG